MVGVWMVVVRMLVRMGVSGSVGGCKYGGYGCGQNGCDGEDGGDGCSNSDGDVGGDGCCEGGGKVE